MIRASLSLDCHPELVSPAVTGVLGSISPLDWSVRGARWILKQVQQDVVLAGHRAKVKPLRIVLAAPFFLFVQPVAFAAALTVETYYSSFEKPLQQFNLRKLAHCIAGKYAGEVQAALRADADLSEIKVGYPDLLNFRCTSAALFKDNQVTVGDGIYQPILAEAMLAQDYAGKALPDVTKAPPLEHLALPEMDPAKLAPRYRTLFAIDAAQHALNLMGECVARAAPSGSFSLAMSEQGSQQESAAFVFLDKTIVACGSQNFGFKPPRFLVRTAISENLYRLLDAVHPVLHEKVMSGA